MSKQYNQKLSAKVIYIFTTAAFTGQQEMDHLFFFSKQLLHPNCVLFICYVKPKHFLSFLPIQLKHEFLMMQNFQFGAEI